MCSISISQLLLTSCFPSVVRGKLSMLIEHWQKVCILAERLIKRREAAAVRLLPPLARRPVTISHLALPPFSPVLADDDTASNESLASSVFSGLMHPGRLLHPDLQADTARLTNTLKALVEVNNRCWRGDDCELCGGVRQGLATVADHTQRHADVLEHRVSHFDACTACYPTDCSRSRPELYSTLRWRH